MITIPRKQLASTDAGGRSNLLLFYMINSGLYRRLWSFYCDLHPNHGVFFRRRLIDLSVLVFIYLLPRCGSPLLGTVYSPSASGYAGTLQDILHIVVTVIKDISKLNTSLGMQFFKWLFFKRKGGLKNEFKKGYILYGSSYDCHVIYWV